MAKVSIIVPVYNTEKYLAQCIDSVISQTYKNWELIMIDDGSTDSSGIILDKYAGDDDRIKIIHKVNEGQFISRRKGILAASGDYILFLDSDDYWKDNCLEVLDKTISAC